MRTHVRAWQPGPVAAFIIRMMLFWGLGLTFGQALRQKWDAEEKLAACEAKEPEVP